MPVIQVKAVAEKGTAKLVRIKITRERKVQRRGKARTLMVMTAVESEMEVRCRGS